MTFARKVWRLLVAIKDGLALLFLLLFFFALYALLSARPGIGSVHDGALLLKLDGSVVEEPKKVEPFATLLSAKVPTAEYRTRDIVRALRTAASDDRIKAVVFDLSRFTGGGMVNLEEIGAAMDQVRAAKKPVLTYGIAYGDNALLLAAHSSEVWLDPMGGAFVTGPGGTALYYGALLDRLKVNVHVFRVGTYKDYVEPFTRTGMSDASRAAHQQLDGALWSTWQADVKRVRPQANLALVTGDPIAWVKNSGGDLAHAAKAAGLVDRIGSRIEFGTRVAQLVGKDDADPKPGSFAHTSLRAWLNDKGEDTHGKAIAVVTVAGEIVDGDAGPGSAGGDRIAKLIDQAIADKVPALVLRVDSPGGSVMASEVIRDALVRAKAKGIPVVVSMANLAASGGYWVSTPGQRIFAEPGTITGSIGVFAIVPTFEKTLASWGVNGDGVQTTKLSGQPNFFTGLTPEVEAMLQANVEGTYAKFLNVVGRSRGKTLAQVDTIAQGRVWDGGTARQLGLVDQFGGLDQALAYAAGVAKLKQGDWHPKFYGEDHSAYANFLSELTNNDEDAPPQAALDWAGLINGQQRSLAARATSDVERLIDAGGVQAYCAECPAVAEPVDAGSMRGVVARLLAWVRPR